MASEDRAAGIWLAILAWIAGQFVLVHDLPLLSDDHVLLQAAAGWQGLGDWLAAEPRRPLQHLAFGLGRWCGDAAPVAMRALSGVCLLAALGLLAAVGRQIGMTRRRAALAAGLFAVVPMATTLWWPAAVSSPGRLAATLLAMWAFARRTRGGGVLAVLAAAAAILFHPSAVLLPLVLVVHTWALRSVRAPAGGAWTAQLGDTLRDVVRRPAFWAIGAVVVAAALWIRATNLPHHGSRSPAAVVANLTWAAAGLWPECLRVLAVDGVRGVYGSVMRIGGAAALLGCAAFALAAVLRDRGALRAMMLAALAELAFAAAVAGWTARYAFVATAFVVLGAMRRASTRTHRVLLAVVAVVWAADSVRALLEFRCATLQSASLVAAATAARRQLPLAEPLYVLDPPLHVGFGRDTPLCNWGFAEAVAATGASGEVRLVHTQPVRGSAAGERIDAAAARALCARQTVLEYDAALRTFVRWRDGGRDAEREERR